MYNERNENFSVRDFIVQLLFIVLFIFILIWLFPTKGSLKGKFNKLDEVNTKFDVLTNGIFNDNLQTMKEAAIGYYTTPRLPKNINDVKSMTLREMLKEKLLVEFKDANNKSCDLDDSYVEITKLEDEYLLKVNLDCTDNSAYILVHLGCYNYCNGGVCEKKETPTKPVENKPVAPVVVKKYCEYYNGKYYDKNGNIVSKDAYDKSCNTKPQPVCTYKYEKTETISKWSDWSNWSTEVETPTKTKEVKQKTVTIDNAIIGEKEITRKRAITRDIEKTIEKVSKKYCTSVIEQKASNGQNNYDWIDQGTKYYSEPPVSDATTVYKFEGSDPISCGDCYNGVMYKYRKYTLKANTSVTGGKEICTSWKTIEKPVTITVPVVIKYETYKEYEPVYGTKKVKQYSYRTLTTSSKTLTKYSSVKNDQTLLNQDYKYVSSECK